MTLSSVPAPPSSRAALHLCEEGWIHLPRPAELTPADFETALQDLASARKLEWRVINRHVYVRWIQ